MVSRGDVRMDRVSSAENTTDPLTKPMSQIAHTQHLDKLGLSVVAWKSFKQAITADSTTETEYIAASEAAKEVGRMKNYIQELGVVPSITEPVVIFCDNNGVIAQAKEPRSHHRSKNILRLPSA
ncbi:UNVERIFIED_CONTAM: Retrovirus-related Pol polyprotein from transposon TNT 1-94 [Sesamum angustifolium]|uniref:Retrovirus-related Pol polyprotein from transposon TNT 1-94 n=1 Tax=Sesamum angustifolium TaxID=2727405 RepID=A0AAW2MKZ0_9LAMI